MTGSPDGLPSELPPQEQNPLTSIPFEAAPPAEAQPKAGWRQILQKLGKVFKGKSEKQSGSDVDLQEQRRILEDDYFPPHSFQEPAPNPRQFDPGH